MTLIIRVSGATATRSSAWLVDALLILAVALAASILRASGILPPDVTLPIHVGGVM